MPIQRPSTNEIENIPTTVKAIATNEKISGGKTRNKYIHKKNTTTKSKKTQVKTPSINKTSGGKTQRTYIHKKNTTRKLE